MPSRDGWQIGGTRTDDSDPRQALYVSDLDGTLLRSDGSLSPYSLRTLARLIHEGMLSRWRAHEAAI